MCTDSEALTTTRSLCAPGMGGRKLNVTAGRTVSSTSVVNLYMLTLPARSLTEKMTLCAPGFFHL